MFTTEACDSASLHMLFHKFVQDYNLFVANTRSLSIEPFMKFQSWHPPLDDRIKINFDAFVPSNVHRGLGIIFRDKDGKILLAGVRCSCDL